MWRLYSIALGSIVQPPYLGYCKLFQVTVIRSCGLVLFFKTQLLTSSLNSTKAIRGAVKYYIGVVHKLRNLASDITGQYSGKWLTKTIFEFRGEGFRVDYIEY